LGIPIFRPPNANWLVSLKTPGHLISSVEIEGKPRPLENTPAGYGNKPAGKKLGWKEKSMDSRSLAMFDTYHLPRKHTRYLFLIFTDICGVEDFSGGDRWKPGYRLEWQGAFRLRGWRPTEYSCFPLV